jgi:hypothetical protein
MDESTVRYYSKQTRRVGGPVCDHASGLIETVWGVSKKSKGPLGEGIRGRP